MKCTIALFLIFTPFVFGVLQWREKGYLKLPYDTNNRFGLWRDGATKASYHRQNRMLYVIGRGTKLLHIIDLTNPDSPRIAFTKEFNTLGDGEVTDVQTCDDMVAISIANNEKTVEGHVELFVPFTNFDSTFNSYARVAVGVYPKSLALTPDCSRVVVVNEGKPGIRSNTGAFYDPEGSITIIIRNDAGFPPEININFQSFDSRVTEYVTKGVRYIFRGDPQNGITSTLSKDLEPEDVVVDDVGRFAYISFMENNAIAKLDLTTNLFIDLYALGAKNWSNFDMDGSDRDGGPNLKRYNIWSFYQPGDIKYFPISNQGYLFTANTGGMRTYRQATEGYEFTDGGRARALNNAGVIDQALVGSNTLASIQTDNDIGRLHISKFDGLNNQQNLVQYVHAFGGRSVTMWNTATFQRVYDTGDDMEKQVANTANGFSSTFNGEASNANLSPAAEVDLRSDDYGVQPNAVDVGNFNGSPIMVSGARTGHLFVYRIIGTALSFQSIHRRGSDSMTWNNLYTANMTGDAIITDLGYMDEATSPSRTPMVYVIGSGSSSVSLYELYDDGITKK